MASRDSDELPEVFQLIRLRDGCRRFIEENRIECYGDIWTTISINSVDTVAFIESICKLIGYCGQER